MRRFVVFGMVWVGFALFGMPAAAEVAAPPAINLPAGGKIVTEINLSDSDVLGIIKQSIPAVEDVAKQIAPMFARTAGASSGPDLAKAIDLKDFSEAISGVQNVRMLIARYPKYMTAERFLAEFTMGVAKSGQFSKTISDFGFFPGSVALFSAPDNGGIIAFAYNADEGTAYAARVVGGVDIPKLIRWSGEIAKAFIPARVQVQPNAMEQPAADDAGPALEAQPPAESN